MSSFYSEDELRKLGLRKYGKNVLISKKASLYSPEKMEFGDNVRIDDFCVLSGTIKLQNYIHISVQAGIFAGRAEISIGDYTAISSRVMVYAENDDYSGESMVNPLVPEKCRKVQDGPVVIGRHCIVGSGSIILPKIEIGDGVAVGAMSLVNRSLEPWGMYAGIPVKYIKARSKNLLKYENEINK